ncbi:MAG: FAD-dependent oxidoreductase [Gemmatimonadetes bacterium]|nr:FAD-dependent oxidoreductase [Gemmatimonadota bacterium]
MHVAVVGGGLAGLVAALELATADAAVTLLESDPTPGGQVRTRREAGFVVEDGAEGFVSGDQDVPDLCRALGISQQLVPQTARRSLLLRDGRLTELSGSEAASLLGIQASSEDLGRGITSLTNGMAALTEALVTRLDGRARVHAGRPVTALQRARNAWRLEHSGGKRIEADAIVLAAEPTAIAALIAPLAAGAAQVLRSLSQASNVSVSLGYDRVAVSHPLDGSGLVVAPTESNVHGLRACAFSSSKFPNRAPAGSVLLRAFFRPDDDEIRLDDRAWGERAAAVLGGVLGIRGAPAHTWVARWPHALPLYGRDHATAITSVASSLRAAGPLELAGSAYHPGGVPGAIRSGRLAARRILDAGAERREGGKGEREE